MRPAGWTGGRRVRRHPSTARVEPPISATEPPCAAPSLADVLGTLLPDPAETLLLRACLLSGEPAREAWRSWRARGGGRSGADQANSAALKGLLPLIYLYRPWRYLVSRLGRRYLPGVAHRFEAERLQ